MNDADRHKKVNYDSGALPLDVAHKIPAPDALKDRRRAKLIVKPESPATLIRARQARDRLDGMYRIGKALSKVNLELQRLAALSALASGFANILQQAKAQEEAEVRAAQLKSWTTLNNHYTPTIYKFEVGRCEPPLEINDYVMLDGDTGRVTRWDKSNKTVIGRVISHGKKHEGDLCEILPSR